MNKILPLSLAAVTALLLTGAGCASASLDLASDGDPNRVLNGTVNFRSEVALPPDAEVNVRLLDMASIEQTRAVASHDLPVPARAQVELPPTVLAEQTLRVGTMNAVPFHLEFRADDDVLRHGLNVDARISYDGKVRFRTVNAHVVTLSSLGRAHEVWVMATGR